LQVEFPWNFVWAKKLGGTSNDNGACIVLDTLDNIYTTGYFSGVADFDPESGTFNLTAVGGADIFVHEIIQRLPPLQQPVFSTIANEYCSTIGTQSFKLLNLPDTTIVSVSIKLDATILSIRTDSSFSITINTLSVGSHHIEVKYTNASESKTTTKDFAIVSAETPDVNVTASVTTVTNSTPVTITAINATGGGTAPLFTFGKDQNMNNIWQAESANNTSILDPSNLVTGQNEIYVRMRTSATCYTTATNTDSIAITKQVATGIRDIDYPNQEISVHPNPFNKSFELNGLQIFKSYSMSLTNLTGQTIFQRDIRNNTSFLFNGPVPPGNYWLILYDRTKMHLLGIIPLIKN
jgi:hypothetical protein